MTPVRNTPLASLAVTMEEGLQPKDMGVSRSWSRWGVGAPLGPPEGASPAHTWALAVDWLHFKEDKSLLLFLDKGGVLSPSCPQESVRLMCSSGPLE